MSRLKVRVNGAWTWVEKGLTEIPGVPNVYRQPIDGGKTFYADRGYTVAAPVLDDPNFFPIAVWFESVQNQSEIDLDKDTGLNMYVELTTNSDLALIRSNGMYAIPSGTSSVYPSMGSETLAYCLPDETDLNYGHGWGPGQGYAVQQSYVDGFPQNDGRFLYANYTVGVLIPSFGFDDGAAVFINNFQQTASADFYWMTGPNIYNTTGAAPWNQASQFYRMYERDATADEARRPSHYGNVVKHLRDLTNPARWEPVWGFVENGGPFPSNVPADFMTPEVMKAAVWHMIIQGARGIIYFNHTFATGYESQHNFRFPDYAAIQAAAKEVNGRVQSLAAVINDDFAINFVGVSPAATPFSGIEVMAKYHDDTFYVFAASRENGSTARNATFAIPAGVGSTATVLFENRTVPIVGGVFTDTFADGNTVHIYRIDA